VSPSEDVTLTLPRRTIFLITDEWFVARLNTIHGRLAARMFAYSIQASDAEGAKQVLDIVEREG
jgi:hypothetical protein